MSDGMGWDGMGQTRATSHVLPDGAVRCIALQHRQRWPSGVRNEEGNLVAG